MKRNDAVMATEGDWTLRVEASGIGAALALLFSPFRRAGIKCAGSEKHGGKRLKRNLCRYEYVLIDREACIKESPFYTRAQKQNQLPWMH